MIRLLTDSMLKFLTKQPAAGADMKGSDKYPEIRGLVTFYPFENGTVVLADICGLPQAEEAPSHPAFDAPETVLRIEAGCAYRVLDEFEPWQRQRQADGGFLVRVRYPVDDWLIGYILSFGPEAEVLEPPCLRKAVREALQKTAGRYGK